MQRNEKEDEDIVKQEGEQEEQEEQEEEEEEKQGRRLGWSNVAKCPTLNLIILIASLQLLYY